ncbi:hypothetical protein BW716_20675 [[Flexibacter] sp. ATCC 35208]|nr:hypothetical protein BW716_20675 [[Flexibacter] sp. ATCC 35208]
MQLIYPATLINQLSPLFMKCSDLNLIFKKFLVTLFLYLVPVIIFSAILIAIKYFLPGVTKNTPLSTTQTILSKE